MDIQSSDSSNMGTTASVPRAFDSARDGVDEILRAFEMSNIRGNEGVENGLQAGSLPRRSKTPLFGVSRESSLVRNAPADNAQNTTEKSKEPVSTLENRPRTRIVRPNHLNLPSGHIQSRGRGRAPRTQQTHSRSRSPLHGYVEGAGYGGRNETINDGRRRHRSH